MVIITVVPFSNNSGKTLGTGGSVEQMIVKEHNQGESVSVRLASTTAGASAKWYSLEVIHFITAADSFQIIAFHTEYPKTPYV